MDPARWTERELGLLGPRTSSDSDPTDPSPHLHLGAPQPLSEIDEVGGHVRLFGSRPFFRLWLSQVVSAVGDWLGFLAIAVLATRVGTHQGEAVAVVMAARLLPGFFLAPVAGVFADRWDRRRLMVACDVGRAAVVATLPFVESLRGLVLASLLLELLTLMWAPAKEAVVPDLVPEARLTSANSLSLAAAYGTFPLSSLLFTVLAAVSAWLAGMHGLDLLHLDRQGSLAFYVDVGTFLFAALLVARLPIPRRRPVEHQRTGARGALNEVREGWRAVASDGRIRGVNLGLGLALVGGGMLVPLGPVFSIQILHAGDAGFGMLLTALGFGAGLGILAVNALQTRLPRVEAFAGLVVGCGLSLVLASSGSSVIWVTAWVAVLGACAGSTYVLGFTILHETVDERLRGRTFSALFTLVRMCVLMAFVLGPVLCASLDRLSGRVGGHVGIGGIDMAVPGVRLTLWLAGTIIVAAGLLASGSLRSALRRQSDHPSKRVLLLDPA